MSLRWQFEKAVRDQDLGLTTKGKVVGYALASRMNSSGRCDPGIGRLVSDTGLSATTVREGRDELVRAGLLQVTPGGGRAAGGGGRTNLYQALATPRVTNPSPNNPLCGEPEDLQQDLGLKIKERGLEEELELDVTSRDASRARARDDAAKQAGLFAVPHPGAYSGPGS